MPELPEVEIVVRGLIPGLIDKKILSFWTNSPKLIKNASIKEFESNILNRKVISVSRRAKNIIINLDGGYSLLVHLKMTGHLLFGRWELSEENALPITKGAMEEKVNSYIRIVFTLSDGNMLGFSDLRKFGKLVSGKTEKLLDVETASLGTDALEITFADLKKTLRGTKRKIKQILLDQTKIAGIGNIYADEVLWKSKIHPETSADSLTDEEIKILIRSIKEILNLAIELGGSSISDYRNVSGAAGQYADNTLVYKRENMPCKRCKTFITKKKIGGRTARYCPKCQIKR